MRRTVSVVVSPQFAESKPGLAFQFFGMTAHKKGKGEWSGCAGVRQDYEEAEHS